MHRAKITENAVLEFLLKKPIQILYKGCKISIFLFCPVYVFIFGVHVTVHR